MGLHFPEGQGLSPVRKEVSEAKATMDKFGKQIPAGRTVQRLQLSDDSRFNVKVIKVQNMFSHLLAKAGKTLGLYAEIPSEEGKEKWFVSVRSVSNRLHLEKREIQKAAAEGEGKLFALLTKSAKLLEITNYLKDLCAPQDVTIPLSILQTLLSSDVDKEIRDRLADAMHAKPSSFSHLCDVLILLKQLEKKHNEPFLIVLTREVNRVLQEPLASLFQSHTQEDVHSSQKIVDRLQELISLASNTNEPLPFPYPLLILNTLLTSDKEIRDRLAVVIEAQPKTLSEQWSQLHDIQHFFEIAYRKTQEKTLETLKKSPWMLALTKVVDQALEIYCKQLVPPWQTHMDHIQQIVEGTVVEPARATGGRSLLNDVRSVVPDVNTFAHIHAEALIANSKYEGHCDHAILQYIGAYLMRSSGDHILLKMFQDAARLQKAGSLGTPISSWSPHDTASFQNEYEKRYLLFHSTLKSIVASLSPGEKTLVPAGWSGIPNGHSMKVEVERQFNGKLTVILYNTGAGIDHHATIDDQGERFVQPFIEIKNIPEERFLNPSFIKSWMELNSVVEWQDERGTKIKTDFGEKDIYGLFLECLGGDVIYCRGNREEFIRPQQAGICAWASCEAVFLKQLGLNKYRQLMSELSLDSLCAFYQSVNDQPFDEAEHQLLKHAVKRVAQTALDAYQSESITLQRLQDIHATLKELGEILERREKAHHFEKVTHTSLNFSPFPESELQPQSEEEALSLYVQGEVTNTGATSTNQMAANQEQTAAPISRFTFKRLETGTQLVAEMEQLLTHIKACKEKQKEKEGIAAFVEFCSILAKFEIAGEPFWTQIPIEEQRDAIVLLADLSEQFVSDGLIEYGGKWYLHYIAATMLELGRDLPEIGEVRFLLDELLKAQWQVESLEYYNQNKIVYDPVQRVLREKSFEMFHKIYSHSDGPSPLEPDLEEGSFRVLNDRRCPIQHACNWDVRYINQKLNSEEGGQIIAALQEKFPEREEFLDDRLGQVALALTDWYGSVLPKAFCALRRQHLFCYLIENDYSVPKDLTSFLRSRKIQGGDAIDIVFGATKIALPAHLDENNPKVQVFKGVINKQRIAAFTDEGGFQEMPHNELQVMHQFENPWERDLNLMLAEDDRINGNPHLEQRFLKVLKYFSEHLEDLGDKGVRQICYSLLFEKDYFETIMQGNPSIGKLLMDLLQQGYSYFEERGKLEECMFFVEMGIAFRSISTLRGYPIDFPAYKALLQRKLEDTSLSPNQKTLIYKQLIACFADPNVKEITKEEAQILLQSLFHLRVYPGEATQNFLEKNLIFSRWKAAIQECIQKDPASICQAIALQFDLAALNLETAVRDGKLMQDLEVESLCNGVGHSQKVKDHPIANDSTSRDCVKLPSPTAVSRLNVEWNSEDYPLCRGGDKYVLNIESLEFFLGGKPLTGLPLPIVEDPLFKELFTQPNYIGIISDQPQLGKDYPLYAFEDERKIKTLVGKPAGLPVEIFQEIDGQWYRLDTSLAQNKRLLPKDFMLMWQQASTWIPVSRQALQFVAIRIRDSKSLKTNYILEIELLANHTMRLKEVKKLVEDGQSFSLVPLSRYPDSAVKTHFKDAMLWQDQSHNFQELEVIRLGLHFEMCQDEKRAWRAMSQEYPGYYVSPNQHYRGIDPIKDAICLENEAGKRKLVVPFGQVIPEEKGSLDKTFAIDINPKEDKRSIAIDLDKTSTLIPSQKEAQIYLASLLLAQKEYEGAQRLLRASFSNVVPYNEEELKILQHIIFQPAKGKDESPQAHAVVFVAYALMIKEGRTIPSVGADKNAPDFFQMYRAYRAQKGQIPELALSLEEDEVLQRKFSQSFGIRPQTKVDNTTTLPLFYLYQESFYQIPLVTRPRLVDLVNNYETIFKDLVQLKMFLTLAPPTQIPQDIILIMQATDHCLKTKKTYTKEADGVDFPMSPHDFKQLFQESAYQGEYLKVVALAKKVDEEIQAGINGEKSITNLPIDQAAPASHPRSEEMRTITTRNVGLVATLKPIPLRQSALTDRQMEAVFVTVDNEKGLILTEEEIKELQAAISSGGEGAQPAEAAKLSEAIKSYWMQRNEGDDWHRIDPNKIEKIKTLLLVQRTEREKRAKRMEYELLQMANALPKEAQQAILFETELVGRVREKITIGDLILLTARFRHFTLSKKNPELADQESKLLQMCLEFMDYKAANQQVGRAIHHLEQLQGVQENNKEYLRLSELCYQELNRKPNYLPHEFPELLVFEVLEEIGIHDWQVKELMRLIHPKDGESPEVVLEKAPGSGKSKVYLPMVALANADGEHLSVVVVHASQYGNVALAMQTTSGDVFGQVAHRLEFSRESDTSVQSLQKILKQCEKVIKERQFLILTDKTMHNLILAYDLLMDQYLLSDEEALDLAERVELMGQIVHLFQDKGRAILDEADLLLNCKHEVVYSIGQAVPMDSHHSDLISELYRSIENELKELKPFTLAGYEALKPSLIEGFVKSDFVRQMTDYDEELFIDYLRGGKEGAEYVEKIQSKRVKDQLAIALEEFKEILPIVLEKRCGEHFGYSDDPEKILPVPFIASGVPSPTSEFGFPYVLLSYTMQTLKAEGVSFSLLKSLINGLQNRAVLERKADPTLRLQDTKAYHEFRELCGGTRVPFLNINDQDIDKIAASYKGNQTDLHAFAKKYFSLRAINCCVVQ